MSQALILMDYQEGLCRPDGPIGSSTGLAAQIEERGTLAAAERCLGAARAGGMRVFHVRVGFDPGYVNRTNRSGPFGDFEANGLMEADSNDARICHEVAPQDGEPVVTKGCVDPFAAGALEGMLQAASVHTLFLGGVATNFVVESVARYAGDRGYDVRVVEDMCASYSAVMHDFAIQNVLPVFSECISADRFEQLAGESAG